MTTEQSLFSSDEDRKRIQVPRDSIKLTNLTGDWTDKNRLEWLKTIDADEDHEVSQWEADYIESQLNWARVCKFQDRPFTMTDRQRKVVEDMYQKYGT